MAVLAPSRHLGTNLSLELWFRYLNVVHALATEVQRFISSLHLGVAIMLATEAQYLHALPILSSVSSRLLLGAILFFGYAGWTTVPALHRAYAVFVAAHIVPKGDAYSVIEVHSATMAPAIANGSLVLVDFDAYRHSAPRIGDVVGIDLPRGAYLKRIVALPGDRFEVSGLGVFTNGSKPRGWHNRFYPDYTLDVADDTFEVNGVPIDRSIANVPIPSAWSDPSRLPRNCYVVLGDNINDSEDSHVFGCVPRSGIIGKVLRVL